MTSSEINANDSQQEAANGNAADDCKATTSCTNFADGDTSDGSQNVSNTGNRANYESRTSAKTSGSKVDAPTRKDGDELPHPARVVSESATSTAAAKTLNQQSHRKTHGGKVSLKDDAEKFARDLKKNPKLRKLHQQMDEQWKVYRHSKISYGRKS